MEKGLYIMLEQAPEIFLVEKLRALLLLEADANALHKINFNGRLMNALDTSSAIPQEIIRGRRSQDVTRLA